MSNKSIATIATMGIDIGKNSFHVVGLDRRGAMDSFVQISADVPDIGAEFEPVRTVALVNTLVRLCDRRYAIAASSRCRVNAGSFTSLAWSLSMLATMARPFLTRCVRRRPHRCAPGSLVRLMADVTTTCVNL
jgi:hypothetical protein